VYVIAKKSRVCGRTAITRLQYVYPAIMATNVFEVAVSRVIANLYDFGRVLASVRLEPNGAAAIGVTMFKSMNLKSAVQK
jgi:hypothetical protein